MVSFYEWMLNSRSPLIRVVTAARLRCSVTLIAGRIPCVGCAVEVRGWDARGGARIGC